MSDKQHRETPKRDTRIRAAKSRPPSRALPAAAPKAARSSPQEDSRRIFLRGQQRQQKGDLKGALQEYNRAIQLDPENVDAYANRGVVREATGDVQGAKADYTKSIEIQIRVEISRQLDSQ